MIDLRTAFDEVSVDLPKVPPEFGDGDLWYDGSEILCRTEEVADLIANMIEDLTGCYGDIHTGYYDPEDDKRSNEVNDHTGWWYVDYD